MAIRENLWDCSNCLKTGIPGHLKECPECHDPRNIVLTPEERPYLPDNAPIITDPELLNMANAGPDWNCGFCGEANRGDTKTCSNCNRPKDSDDTVNRTTTYVGGKSAEGVTLDKEPDYNAERIEDDLDEATRVVEGKGEKPRVMSDKILPAEALRHEGEIADRVEGYLEDAQERKAFNRQPSLMKLLQTYKKPLIGGGIGIGAIALVLIIVIVARSFLATTPHNLEVIRLDWQRQVEVEEYRTFSESDWSVPSGGRETDSYRAIRSYNHLLDHYETVTFQDSRTVPGPDESYGYACGSRTVDLGNGYSDTETEYCTGHRSTTQTEYFTNTRQDPVYIDVPIYDTKYDYDIDRWVYDHWETAGAEKSAADPYWPEPTRLRDKQRVGNGRNQRYSVVLKSDRGEEYTREPDFAVWQELKDGQTIVGNITKRGILRSVNWPAEVKT